MATWATWAEHYDQLWSAENQDEVISILKSFIKQEFSRSIPSRRASYTLIRQCVNALKQDSIPELHVGYVMLGSGAGRLRAPIPPTSGQLELFNALWDKLQAVRQEAPVNVVVEVPNHASDDAHLCFTAAERYLMEFKPLSDPLNPHLTEEDIADFWQD